MSDDDIRFTLFIIITVLAIVIFGAIVYAACGQKELYNTRYNTIIVYNSDMTEVLYSANDGCELKEVDGKLVLITGKDE